MKKMLPALLPLLLTGCLVEIKTVSDPGPELDRARADASEVASRPGPAKSLQLVAWTRDERKLVKASLPLWLVHKVADGHDEFELGDEVSDEVEGCLRKVRLQDLEKVGRGALVEVEDEDGTQVLVWLR